MFCIYIPREIFYISLNNATLFHVQKKSPSRWWNVIILLIQPAFARISLLEQDYQWLSDENLITCPWSSYDKVSACNSGDLGSIPGSRRSPWRRKWQPTPVFLPGESHGQRSLVGYGPWGRKESDMTKHACRAFQVGIFNKLQKYQCLRSGEDVF